MRCPSTNKRFLDGLTDISAHLLVATAGIHLGVGPVCSVSDNREKVDPMRRAILVLKVMLPNEERNVAAAREIVQ